MQLTQAKVGEMQQYEIGQHIIPYRDIEHPDGVVRVEYYDDADFDNPSAFTKFRSRLATLQQAGGEIAQWKTIVFETMTSMELASRMFQVKIMNPMTKFAKGEDTRQWFSASTDDCEEILVYGCKGMYTNLVLNCHIDERRNEVSGEILRGPMAPGRVSKRSELGATWQEQYHVYTMRNGTTGVREHLLQTANDGQWVATSQIGAPDPCFPHYESLWVNWQGVRPFVHCFTYGDAGTGKSTFAATWPKPMLVIMFDGPGKDIPFWKTMTF